MSAFGRGDWRWPLLPQGMGAVAVALAASLALADAQPAAGPAPADRGGRVPILSPEAPLSFGDLGRASPLLAAFIAARAAQDPAPDAGLFAEPKVDLAPAAQIAPRDGAFAPFATAPGESAAQDNPPAAVSEPPPGPPLSPMQSALEAAMERLVARRDQVNPLGSGDLRAAR
ncbi:MAG: hypothetical protein ACREDI_07650, partial [Roseiarcus sp.]